MAAMRFLKSSDGVGILSGECKTQNCIAMITLTMILILLTVFVMMVMVMVMVMVTPPGLDGVVFTPAPLHCFTGLSHKIPNLGDFSLLLLCASVLYNLFTSIISKGLTAPLQSKNGE